MKQIALFVLLLILTSPALKAQSVCGTIEGTIEEPGLVSAGTITVPDTAPTDGPDGSYSVVVDGSDFELYTQVGEAADNEGAYPPDAILPESVELEPGIMTSMDYEYVFTICPAEEDTCFIRSNATGALNPADVAEDGSIPPLPIGSSICVTGFTYSLTQFNYILDLIANPILCGVIEPEFPEGITCEQIAEYAEGEIRTVNDLLILTNLFGYTANTVPEALYALGAIENLMVENGLITLTPCYSVVNWSSTDLSTAAVINNAPDGSSESEVLQLIGDEWGGNSYCMTVIEVDMCPFMVDAGEVSVSDSDSLVTVCSNDPMLSVSFANDGESDSAYSYIVTSTDESTVYANFTESFTFFQLPEDTLRVYGFSYTGDFSLSGGAGLEGVSASECYELSESYVEVLVIDCGGVGNEHLGANEVAIYPNPCGETSVQIEAEQGIQRVDIFDLDGRAVYANEGTQSVDKVAVDVSALDTGLYLIQVSSEQGSTIAKLLVQ